MILPIIVNVQPNLFDIIKQVFTSWQVLVITIVVLLYIHIVSHVSKKHVKRPRVKKEKIIKKKEAEPLLGADEDSGSSSNDELGLEEA